MIASLIRLLTGVNPRWVGCLPSDGPRIYIANHQSHLDAPVIWAALPGPLRRYTRPVAARDYWNRGWLRRWLAHRVFHALLVDRMGGSSAASEALDAMGAALDAGLSLILFPEGRRQDDEDGEMQAFKGGLWHLAKSRPQVEVVPVHLAQLSRILPKGEWLPVPLLGSATFGAPLVCAADEPKATFLQRARAAVLATGEEPS